MTHSLMQGFPPPAEQRVTLANWDSPPYNRWAFQHVRRLLPTAAVSRGDGPVCPLPAQPVELDDVALIGLDGAPATLDQYLVDTFTDGFIVLHDGVVCYERYLNDMTPATLHLSQSVAKSVVGTVAGVLVDRGVLDPQALVTDYVPELASGGYQGARITHLLNMTSGVRFIEDYIANPTDSDIAKLDIATGWKPARPDADYASVYELAVGLAKEAEHGTRFEYRSIETDVLAWAIERASGVYLPDLVSRELWVPLGVERDADFAVDRAGSAVADGGFNATLRDYARFAQMHLDRGRFNDRQIVSAEWVDRCRTGDHALFDRVPYNIVTPNGAYANQWWVRGVDAGTYMARGIFGQLIYLDPAARLAVVKLSTWPTPLAPHFLSYSLRAMDAIAARLAPR